MADRASVHTEISQMYVALFGRAPDAEGLAFWTGSRLGGMSVVEAADAMFATAPARIYYPAGLSHQQIVASFYANVLGRTADAEGLAFWTAKLDAPGATPGSVIAEMVDNVTHYEGTNREGLRSAALFGARSEIALSFAETNGDIAQAAQLFSGPSAAPAGATLTLGPDAIGTYHADGYSAIQLGLLAGDVTVDGVGSGTYITFTASPQIAPTYTPGDPFADYNSFSAVPTDPNAETDADTGEAAFLTFRSTEAIDSRSIDMSGFEYLHIASTDADAVRHTNHLAIEAGSLRSLIVTGNTDLQLGVIHAGAQFSFLDASRLTGDLELFTGPPTGITLITGAGNDRLEVATGGADFIDGGAGNDYLAAGDGLSLDPNVLVGGAGADVFHLNFNYVDCFFANTIADFSRAEGDLIQFSFVQSTTTWHSTPIQLAAGATLRDYMDAAASTIAYRDAAEMKWFQWEGDTYVVVDRTNVDFFVTENFWDQAVKLTGLVDLRGATLAERDTVNGYGLTLG
jgi:hypothetical protein